MTLREETSRPIRKGEPALSREEAAALGREAPAWAIGDTSMEREFEFRDFREAMDFANKVAAIANAQNHHPDICVSYSKVRLVLSTHKIGGLSRNDFIVAAKIDELLQKGR